MTTLIVPCTEQYNYSIVLSAQLKVFSVDEEHPCEYIYMKERSHGLQERRNSWMHCGVRQVGTNKNSEAHQRCQRTWNCLIRP